jgi:hypothetical protein
MEQTLNSVTTLINVNITQVYQFKQLYCGSKPLLKNVYT